MDKSTPADKSETSPLVVGIAAIGECVLWTGYRNRLGYGVRRVGKRTVLAHRQAWAEVHGDPGSLCVCHRCDVRACINVEHLFLGTRADNMADMVAKGRQSRNNGLQVGERNARAKLTDDKVREIRLSTESNIAIARRLDILPHNVSQIRLRKRWNHLP